MSFRAGDIGEFLSREPGAMVAKLLWVKGSSPREAGTFMLVGARSTLGTIGGGQLEYRAIRRAREMMRDAIAQDELDVPLGPEIGQCCGGHVAVSLLRADADKALTLFEGLRREEERQPHVYLFGAGHVGHALARALSLLPLKVHVVDTRPEELTGFPDGVTALATALPEAAVRHAPLGTSYFILTHDHALDFLIAAEALKRVDSPYVGMVGSKTKRARFASWFAGQGQDKAALERLILPIGGKGLGDKRPEVIAALAAAEVMVHIGRAAESNERSVTEIRLGAINGR